jgi:hypothetical protein
VTATSIKLGVAYVDLAAIHQLLGITYDEGSYPDAYQALVNNINSHGGINGRKIQLVTTAVSPIGTAADATACTELTEDDKVFAAILYQQLNPLCYIQTHSTHDKRLPVGDGSDGVGARLHRAAFSGERGSSDDSRVR